MGLAFKGQAMLFDLRTTFDALFGQQVPQVDNPHGDCHHHRRDGNEDPLEADDGFDASAAEVGDHVWNNPIGDDPHKNEKTDDKNIHAANTVENRFQSGFEARLT